MRALAASSPLCVKQGDAIMSNYNPRALRYDCIEPHESRQAVYTTTAGRFWLAYATALLAAACYALGYIDAIRQAVGL